MESQRSKSSFLDQNWVENDPVFNRFLLSVLIVISFYGVLFYQMGSMVSLVSDLFGIVVLTPVTWFINRRAWKNTARVLFVLSCNFYILATSIGMNHQLDAEVFCFPAMMFGFLLFEMDQTNFIYASMLFPLVTFALIHTRVMFLIPEQWVFQGDPGINFEVLSFLLSGGLLGFFLYSFMSSSSRHKKLVESFFMHSPDLMCVLGSNGQLKRVNPSFLRILGYSEGECLMAHPLEFVHPDDRPSLSEQMERLNEGFTILNYEARFRHKLGNYITIDWSARAEPGVNDYFATGRDISWQIEVNEALERERAKSIQSSKLATLGEMSAGIAHEINNPLTIVDGNLQLLERVSHDSISMLKRVRIMLDATKRIGKIVNGLRKYSRTADDLDAIPLSLAAVVEEAMILTENRARHGMISIQFELDGDAKVLCNEIEIEQVLINLMNNSMDAIKNLEERWVRITLTRERDWVVLRITDSGSGIPKEIAEKLFQPFFTTKAIGEGTGLGLSIAKGILESHGACISLLPSEKNTCFEIRFPVIS